MKQRAIKRCIKRALKRPDNYRKVTLTHQLAGSVVIPSRAKCILFVKSDDIEYQSHAGGFRDGGHNHWVNSTNMRVALSYA